MSKRLKSSIVDIDTTIEDVITSSAEKTKTGILNFIKSSIKKHFGIEILSTEWYIQFRLIFYLLTINEKIVMENMSLGNDKMIEAFIDAVHNKPVSGEYILSRFNMKNGTFFMKVDKNTFILVSVKDNQYNHMQEMRLYLFGKGAYRELKKIKNYMGNNVGRRSEIYHYVHDENYFTGRYCPLVDRSILIIDDSIWNNCINYIDRYMKIFYSLYKKNGIIKSGGILLYGKPGTGKSSLINAIANYYRADIYFVDMEHMNDCFSNIRDSVGEWGNYHKNLTLCVFEDIDVFIKDRKDNKKKEKGAFNMLLQFLDGSASIPNSINIATTNDIDSLDDAIIREGRFDLKIEMKDLDIDLAKKLCDSFHVSHSILDGETMPINPAYLQSKIIKSIK